MISTQKTRGCEEHSTKTILWITLIFLAFAIPGCNKGNPAEAGKKQGSGGPPPVSIHTTPVMRISIPRQVTLSGTLISPDQAKVSSEVPGIIRKVAIELGQEVTVGQPLVYLDPRELELALNRAESQLRQTEAQLGIDGVKVKEPLPVEQIASVRTATANRNDARTQLARANKMFSQGLVPVSELDTARTRMEVTEAAYQSALESVVTLKATLQDRRAAFELARKKLSDVVIRAPVAGAVSERLVQTGEFISERTPICTIVQMNPLKLKTAIQERHVSLIKPSQDIKFTVESFPGETFHGRVAFISPAIEQVTRTFVVEALVDNKDRRLKPGFFAKGTVFTRLDENVLSVPEGAISTLAGVSAVFVIEGNKVRQQSVSLGVQQGELVEIVEGLKGDETLASSNLSQLATDVVVRTGAAPAAGDNVEMKPGARSEKRGESK